jgi:putative transposase
MPTQRALTGRPTSPRLPGFGYRGAFRYFLTLCTYERRPLFAGAWPYEFAVIALSRAAGRYGFHVLAYCFMPDHLHLLIEGDEVGDVGAFIKLFKQTTSYTFRREGRGVLWQRSYYDRVLRADEDAGAVVRYILNNPVRRRLVDDARDYPFLGSFVAPVDEWL